ncbi:hypothetical protein AOLI_G00198810 [Acnodon oligacanthus]
MGTSVLVRDSRENPINKAGKASVEFLWTCFYTCPSLLLFQYQQIQPVGMLFVGDSLLQHEAYAWSLATGPES